MYKDYNIIVCYIAYTTIMYKDYNIIVCYIAYTIIMYKDYNIIVCIFDIFTNNCVTKTMVYLTA